VDPGIGFGKTHQHNLTLTSACGRFHDLACPVLVGHSRKAFLGKILGDKTLDRTAATVGAAMTLARAGIQVIRVHDVLPVRQALLAFAATGGIDGRTATLS
jgi:dihydropteroate synthase